MTAIWRTLCTHGACEEDYGGRSIGNRERLYGGLLRGRQRLLGAVCRARLGRWWSCAVLYSTSSGSFVLGALGDLGGKMNRATWRTVWG